MFESIRMEIPIVEWINTADINVLMFVSVCFIKFRWAVFSTQFDWCLRHGYYHHVTPTKILYKDYNDVVKADNTVNYITSNTVRFLLKMVFSFWNAVHVKLLDSLSIIFDANKHRYTHIEPHSFTDCNIAFNSDSNAAMENLMMENQKFSRELNVADGIWNWKSQIKGISFCLFIALALALRVDAINRTTTFQQKLNESRIFREINSLDGLDFFCRWEKERFDLIGYLWLII